MSKIQFSSMCSGYAYVQLMSRQRYTVIISLMLWRKHLVRMKSRYSSSLSVHQWHSSWQFHHIRSPTLALFQSVNILWRFTATYARHFVFVSWDEGVHEDVAPPVTSFGIHPRKSFEGGAFWLGMGNVLISVTEDSVPYNKISVYNMSHGGLFTRNDTSSITWTTCSREGKSEQGPNKQWWPIELSWPQSILHPPVDLG